jgi:hypothetical protein
VAVVAVTMVNKRFKATGTKAVVLEEGKIEVATKEEAVTRVTAPKTWRSTITSTINMLKRVLPNSQTLLLLEAQLIRNLTHYSEVEVLLKTYWNLQVKVLTLTLPLTTS